MEISFLSLSYTQAHISQFLELNFILNEYNYKISNIFTESMLKKKKSFISDTAELIRQQTGAIGS